MHWVSRHVATRDVAFICVSRMERFSWLQNCLVLREGEELLVQTECCTWSLMIFKIPSNAAGWGAMRSTGFYAAIVEAVHGRRNNSLCINGVDSGTLLFASLCCGKCFPVSDLEAFTVWSWGCASLQGGGGVETCQPSKSFLQGSLEALQQYGMEAEKLPAFSSSCC